MAYLVLARKWRPQTWGDVVGQNHVTATLQNAIAHDRLAHAYLFAGPRGVGKTSAARILSKTLNCENPSETSPCDECTNCREIAGGNSVDVFEIDGASNRGIDEVRNLRENIRYSPAHGKYKIYIIDEVHMLTNEAFNALLKTLEEPPEHVLFIFATTEPHRLPATIISRCQRFDFHRIRSKDIGQHLRKVCDAEKIEIDDEALTLIARKADGGLRDSQSILDQMISYTEGRITVESVTSALGLIDLDVFFEVSAMISGKENNKAMALVEKVVSDGVDIEEFTSGLTEHFRHLLIAAASGQADLLDVSAAHQRRYVETAQDFQQEDLLRHLHILANAGMSLKRDNNPRITLELTLLKMVNLDKSVQIGQILDALGNLQMPEGRLEQPLAASVEAGSNLSSERETSATDQSVKNKSADPDPIKEPEKAESGNNESASPLPKSDTVGTGPETSQDGQAVSQPPVSQPDVQAEETPSAHSEESPSVPPDPALIPIETIQEKWDEVIARVKKKKITIGSFLEEGLPHKLSAQTLEIGFAESNGFHIDAIMRCHEMVEEVLAELLGEPLTIRCLKGDFAPQKQNLTTREQKEAHLRDLSQDNPVIQKLIDDFGAEVVD